MSQHSDRPGGRRLFRIGDFDSESTNAIQDSRSRPSLYDATTASGRPRER